MVAIVGQATSYNCALACLESILRDRGQVVSQECLIRSFPQECSSGQTDPGGNDITGSVHPFRLPFLLLACGLGPNLRTGKAPTTLLETGGALEGRRNGAILLVPHRNLEGAEEHHCVRVARIVPDVSVTVMDPAMAAQGLQTWPWEHLAARDCDVISVWE